LESPSFEHLAIGRTHSYVRASAQGFLGKIGLSVVLFIISDLTIIHEPFFGRHKPSGGEDRQRRTPHPLTPARGDPQVCSPLLKKACHRNKTPEDRSTAFISPFHDLAACDAAPRVFLQQTKFRSGNSMLRNKREGACSPIKIDRLKITRDRSDTDLLSGEQSGWAFSWVE
jgi:hypothetical protein